MASLPDSKKNFDLCLSQLRASSARDMKDDTLLAGFLKHFELTFETGWKVLRAVLVERHGVETTSPRTAIEAAYRHKLIADETGWLEMIKDRNLSVHVYNANDARALAARVKARDVGLLGGLSQL